MKKKIFPGFLSLSLFFFLLVLCFSLHKLYMLAFPSWYFLLALPPFPTFSLSTSSPRLLFLSFFFSCFFPVTSITRFYPLSCNRANDRKRRRRRRKKRKKSCRCCCHYCCMHLSQSVFFFLYM